ncbi:MAG TPA: purine-nucleoside phosphorylase [Candidatus Faecousia intestinigallinarum]|nr:purine-nucleoside phosphorylase [Candidatus Faecousia intestinigallinarum]
MKLAETISAAADYLLSHVQSRPTIGLVLGSGLGDFADTLENPVRVPYAQIPDFPQPTVAGHSGAFVFGRRCGREVVVLQGRLHYYEGFTQQALTLPIRVLAAMGVKTLVLTNAAGGVNLGFHAGCLMLISDHINYSGQNPLIGENLDAFGPRFPDVSDLYTARLRAAVKERAAQAGIPLEEGVYMMFSGPNYETPAEVRMARILGADAVGMSTVPEALAAGHSGMEVIGVSCITNMAAGVLPVKLSHQEVVETANRVHDDFHRLLETILAAI